MTDYAISQLSPLTSPASGDYVPVLDVSDTTTAPAGAAGSDKKATVGTLASAFASLAGDKVSAQLLGADPTGTTAIDTVVNGIISGLGTQGGEIFLGEGTFKVSTGLLAHILGSQTVTIRGAGAAATILQYYGSGDCVRMYNSQAYGSGGAQSYFSGVRDLTIDGTHATGSAVGLHAGDITFLQVQNVVIQNFTGTSSIGLHLDNTTNWTEEGDYRAAVSNCTRGVVLDVTTGYSSYGYSKFDLTFFQTGAQSCFSVANGAFLYHSALRFRGDVNGSATALTGNPAVIVVSGLGPSGSLASGANPGITASHFDVMIEPNNQGGTATHLMGTMFLDTTSSFGYVSECYGLLEFSQGTGSFTPINSAALAGSNSNFSGFSGIIAGDSNLNPSGAPGWNVWGSGSILNYLPGITTFDGFFPTALADAFFTTLDGSNATVALNFSGAGNGSTLAGPQRKLFFVRQPASGGPYTLTWLLSGSATNASPTIVWAGGAPPATSTVANGTDVIEALTWDGATWYARHLTSYGTATAQAVTLAPERQRVSLTTAFSSGTGTSAQNVTGMSAYLPTGTYRLKGWFPCTPAGTTGSTQLFAWTFGGTASSAVVKWSTVSSGTTATYVTGTSVTTATAAITMTSTGIFAEFDGLVTVSVAGTLQLTVKSGLSGDEVTVPAGAYLDIEPLA